MNVHKYTRYLPAGGPYRGKLCEGLEYEDHLKAKGKVFLDTDQPKLANNVFIFFL
jgi:hypothetical protein